MHFQDVLTTLSNFWVSRGCILWQPYHTEVGAGTSNPATFLRVLGPEPWWVAYVEPSIRPADGRYGENPNRLQHYHQYQVILKPSPPDVQELYLQSLEALGLNLAAHDFRFVEDNWESPSLGAWGLGWEAWLDGMEVLQFTYFQECGGVKLDVRACELTYGVERIAMYLQGVENVYDLVWNESGITYGDIYHAGEVEYCKYNFEAADTAKLFQMFEMWEAEAARMLGLGLIMPAYDGCLKLSHLFNLLDARSALSVAERGRFLLRCRKIAEACAKGFLAQREAKGFPLRRIRVGELTVAVPAVGPEAGKDAPAGPPGNAEASTLLLEIGVEELPHGDIQAVLEQAPALMAKLLADARLPHGDIEWFITPRRIAARIAQVPARLEDTEREARGPRKSAALDADGNWTTAARKFAEAQGAAPEDIYFKVQGKDEYCFVKLSETGKTLDELVPGVVEQFLRGLRFRKSMGWEDTTVTFSRPVRWLVALHGARLVPVTWQLRAEDGLGPARELRATRTSHGHRRLAPGPIALESADTYLEQLRGHHVLADRAERMTALREGVARVAQSADVAPEEDPALFEEVCDLVEWPDAVLCAIPEDALALPEDIIITPMKVHQRYFPLRTGSGGLSHHFVAVANGRHDNAGHEVIREGNERVLHARLRDAQYFWETDTRQSLETFAAKLPNILFHQKLGSLADKVARLVTLYGQLAEALPPVDEAAMRQVLKLMKADLATQMVFEFDSLEGVVGMLYARNEGLPEDVAQAIFEHRLPRRAGDDLPQGPLGAAAGILDRLDSLAGYFAIGVRVKGTSDPFGLRRNALALLSICQYARLDLDLDACLRAAVENYGGLTADVDAVLADLLGFFRDRLAAIAREQGYAYDQAAAAINVHAARPMRFWKCLETLAALDENLLQDLAEQTKRMVRIVTEPAPAVDPALLAAEERAMHALLDGKAGEVVRRTEQRDYAGAIEEVSTWLPVIAAYFEQVLVNDEDARIRANRHALVKAMTETILRIADFTQIEKK